MRMPQIYGGDFEKFCGLLRIYELYQFSFQGRTVGYCAKVCPTGAFRNDGTQTAFTGNKGPTGTGSNGNAGPINQVGLAVDPAAVSLLKQQEEYIKWAERQVAGRK